MAAEAQARGWNGVSRRRVPRFQAQAALDVTVLRSGVPDTVPGRSINVCERGIAAVMAGELVPGEVVGIEVHLLPEAVPLRTRAIIRHQERLRCGLEFVGLSTEQQAAIRDWANNSKAAADAGVIVTLRAEDNDKGAGHGEERGVTSGGEPPRGPGKRRRGKAWIVFLVVAAVTAAIGAAVLWWRWNRGWEELESGVKSQQTASTEKPQAQVPADVMEKLLVHRVEPVYPPEARRARLQGIIALDIVVGRDGSVISMRALNGPEELARAAMDALRWWKFEPYRVNGEPAVVETTVAVEFKR